MFSFEVGDLADGLLAPSYGDYHTSVFEARDRGAVEYCDRLTMEALSDVDPWAI